MCSICAILVDSGVRALAGFTDQSIVDLMTQLTSGFSTSWSQRPTSVFSLLLSSESAPPANTGIKAGREAAGSAASARYRASPIYVCGPLLYDY